jgi:selenocysteine-specific elongation factor
MIVVGTAGHIDHGKSSIVKRLTGTDPDRLPEEKARGMTIDLGFAFYRTPDDRQIALIDVPGHERFVKNMIAGAFGIDAVMLVVAADDGWMPQSEEHFQITRLLGVRHGLVVINKIDLVEPDWLDLLEPELRNKLAGSFLQDVPIFRVSAVTGDGFERLAAYLGELASRLEARRDIGKARLAIDRSFIRPGMGGVVTGTLRGGTLKVGQSVGIWPGVTNARIRTLQSNGQEVELAVPGQRTAVSLTGIERDQLVRGGVISDRTDLTYFRDHPVMALSVEMLPNAALELADRRRVLVIVGTTEMEGEVRLYDRKTLSGSESGLVFFIPDQPVYALIGDRFVLRLPTPMITLGGGAVLDHFEHLPRHKDFGSFDYLNDRRQPDLASLILSELRKRVFVARELLLLDADYSANDITASVSFLIQSGNAGEYEKHLFSTAALGTVAASALDSIRAELVENPHLKGLPTAHLERKLSPLGPALLILLAYLVKNGSLELKGELYDLAGRGMSLKGVIKQAYDQIMTALRAQKYEPPTLATLAAGGKVHQQAIKYIIESGEGYRCGSEFLFLSDVWSEVVSFVRQQLREKGRLSVAELKDRFGLTRKYSIPILEELDRLSITQREGDFRTKGKRFEE